MVEVEKQPETNRSGPGSGGATGKGFMPGRSGNPAGRPKKEAIITPYLIEELKSVDANLGIPKARILARAMILAAAKGNGTIAREILNRVDGAVREELQIGVTSLALRIDERRIKVLWANPEIKRAAELITDKVLEIGAIPDGPGNGPEPGRD